MPHVLAVEQAERQKIDTRTPQGIYNAVLAETDNQDFARKIANEVAAQQTLARMKAQGSPP